MVLDVLDILDNLGGFSSGGLNSCYFEVFGLGKNWGLFTVYGRCGGGY